MKLVRVSLLLAVGSITLGCSQTARQMPSKTVMVLVDGSKSVSSLDMLNLYKNSFHTIEENLHPGDTLVAGWITSQSEDQLSLPINVTFAAVHLDTDNPLMRKAERKKSEMDFERQRKTVAARFDQILVGERPETMHTDILGSLELAGRVFHSYDHQRGVLVFFSDMLEDAEGIDFERSDLTEQTRTSLLAKLQGEHRIPDLRGVRVYVVGAAAKRSERFRDIRAFWLDYFAEAGAKASETDYGGPLIRFGEKRPTEVRGSWLFAQPSGNPTSPQMRIGILAVCTLEQSCRCL